ncbi:Protein of unknown function [Anaplasma phagocytophilum]|uniref:Uncharacterized protein n=1 Tax=Anaplasma phagocytophilum TaxID=948 RepID=A0A098EF54_ANAPH|nr:Protein of unknown function [Anaplasma phagocytophilum]
MLSLLGVCTLKGAMNLFLRTAWMSFFIRYLLRGSPRSGNLACISDNGSMSFLCESFWYDGLGLLLMRE